VGFIQFGYAINREQGWYPEWNLSTLKTIRPSNFLIINKIMTGELKQKHRYDISTGGFQWIHRS
jgi:hypothetical protein